jgi:WD40 repeat protein
LVGHQGPISRAFFSPDGNTICSCSEDDTIKLWDASTGREIFTLKGHKGFVYSACFSPDGKKIASGSWDQTIKLWDVHSGLETNTLKGHLEPVKHVAFSPDGKRIVSGSWGRIVKVWDTASGLELLSLSGHSDEILYACFSPDGKKIASSGGGDSTVRIWDASNTMELSILGHRERLRNVAISPDGKFIFSEDDQGNKKFWKTENGKELPFSEAIKIKEHFVNNSTVSQDNEWSVEIQGTEARLVNNKLRQERIARDKENLARWATPNPNWHLAQAIESEKNNQWFAATFHLKKLLEFESYKEDATKRLASIEKKAKAN